MDPIPPDPNPFPLAPGMRHTRQRQLVWDAVRRLGGHCSAEEITTEIQAAFPSFSKSTVYRALEALSASGALHAVRLGDGPVHYEISSEDHQHAICQICSGILHIEHELVAELEEHLEALHHFRPVRTDVLVTGVCSVCARALPGSKTPIPPKHRRTLEHIHHNP
ncbi:MAG: Fur family transcriptional regulator [Candidatus Dormibacteraceae bacterium]